MHVCVLYGYALISFQIENKRWAQEKTPFYNRYCHHWGLASKHPNSYVPTYKVTSRTRQAVTSSTTYSWSQQSTWCSPEVLILCNEELPLGLRWSGIGQRLWLRGTPCSMYMTCSDCLSHLVLLYAYKSLFNSIFNNGIDEIPFVTVLYCNLFSCL